MMVFQLVSWIAVTVLGFTVFFLALRLSRRP